MVDFKSDPVEEIEKELIVLKQVLLQEIIRQTRLESGVDEEMLKKISGYLKVVEKLANVMELRRKELENALSIRLVWDILGEIPEIKALLSDPEIKAEILSHIRARLKNESISGQS